MWPSPERSPASGCWMISRAVAGDGEATQGSHLEPSPTLFLGNKPRVRSIRFAAGHDAEGSQSHVHFDEKLHDSVVMVTQESDSSFLVKVGFLKILHRYEITFTLPSVQRLSKDIREAPVPSLHLKLLSIMPVPEGYSVKCEYTAHKEGVLKEEMLLACEGGAGTCVRVVVQARVMGESARRVSG
ncbi:PREDICTED: UPF0687 protein C20orf27 homolog isoform X4 [Miniopterus natalensis]|uniref:UPF0687 protein C20orf27 homolog isoform X4 n=1 Tax=Miniopterus natalensis TaxID=291302 RepID=UPI0007A6C39E|nr:PREDICTED: UPF0687 protein C20orf27 homolog isoform X4 [Miniopterus natalensis]